MRSVSFWSCTGSIGRMRLKPFMFSITFPGNTKGGLNLIQPTPWLRPSLHSGFQAVQSLLETVGMRALRLGQRFKPFGQFSKTFVTRRLRHSRIHLSVFVRFTFNGGFEIGLGVADRDPRCWITHFL